MAASIIFVVDDTLKSIVAHAAASKKHRKAFGAKRASPAVWLVKDQGVYLMSSGMPRQLADENQPAGSSVVSYAIGCNPERDRFFYDTARTLCGGDDFGEPMDLAFFQKAIAQGRTRIVIKLTPEQVIMEAK